MYDSWWFKKTLLLFFATPIILIITVFIFGLYIVVFGYAYDILNPSLVGTDDLALIGWAAVATIISLPITIFFVVKKMWKDFE
ncbi:hypothetical protein [Sulfuricurvum sp.]|uniref:hypothetical protein n=1 Tax=Sulfuricurvum sp. TaxID=2025608 RepID=UPI002E33C43E|nr:hypothetical protein [Sulfuricurvum sp.]HEX5329393.1 hypothetical protein [Sulfuricurvum sp.]